LTTVDYFDRLLGLIKNLGRHSGQNVVMRQLGVIGAEAVPDATAFQEYLRLFATGLSESHCLAIRALFGGALNDAIQACILEDEETTAAAQELFADDGLVKEVRVC
jgi:hypothetical protein